MKKIPQTICKISNLIELGKAYFQSKLSLRNETYNLLFASAYLLILFSVSNIVRLFSTSFSNILAVIMFPGFLFLVYKLYKEK